MPAVTTNPNYRVIIQKGGSAIQPTANIGDSPNMVQANAQAKLGIRVDNRWVNILEALGFSGDNAGLLGGLAGSTFNTLQIFTGNNFLPNIATTHVWRGSNGIELQLSLRFDAYDDPDKDVIQPIKKLIRMFMPTRGDASEGMINGVLANAVGSVDQWFMHPPGPTPYEYIRGGAAEHLIQIALGKVMVIDNLIPTSLEWEFEQRYTEQGFPIAANVTVGFMNFTIPDANTVVNMFKLGAYAPNNTNSGL